MDKELTYFAKRYLYRYLRGWVSIFQGLVVIITFGLEDPDWESALDEKYLLSLFKGKTQ